MSNHFLLVTNEMTCEIIFKYNWNILVVKEVNIKKYLINWLLHIGVQLTWLGLTRLALSLLIGYDEIYYDDFYYLKKMMTICSK